MTRFSSRALAGAAITVLLGSFAVVPAIAEPVPTVGWVGITEGASFPYGQVPATVGCTTTAVDQVGQALVCTVEGLLPTVGTHVLTAVVADAPVGTLTYSVTATWKLKGFYGPVKEHSTWNTRKGGSTVPLKFKIYEANGVKTHDKADIASFVAAPIPCVGQTVAVGTKTIDFLSITKKGRTLRFHDGAFHQNWKTDKVKATKVIVPAKGHGKDKTKKVIIPSCYQVTMTAVDGQALTALFKLK
jgi:hypothetical protein